MQLHFQNNVSTRNKIYSYCNADITHVHVHSDINDNTSNSKKRKNYRLTADYKRLTISTAKQCRNIELTNIKITKAISLQQVAVIHQSKTSSLK